jgi:heptosyltransferase-2
VSDERIWVRLPNWLGDAMMARPLLHALRRARPTAAILASAPASLLSLLAEEHVFDEAEAWPSAGPARREAISRLRAWRPGVALVLPPSFSAALAAWRCGAARRIGFASEWRSPMLTDAVRRPARGERHLSEEYASLGARLEVTSSNAPVLAVPAAPLAEADVMLSASSESVRGHVVLAPGALYGPAKRWAARRFAELGARLARRGYGVLICGSASEQPVAHEVAAAIRSASPAPGTVTNLAGRTSLGALAALCARAALAVCNDSGLAHLAAAVGAPTLAIFGSTSSGWTAPLGPRVRVLQHATPCAPCFQRECSIGYACLERVGVDEAESAALQLLKARSAA